MCRRHGGNWRRLGPRGRRLWKPGPADPPGQMLQMLEGPLRWVVGLTIIKFFYISLDKGSSFQVPGVDGLILVPIDSSLTI